MGPKICNGKYKGLAHFHKMKNKTVLFFFSTGSTKWRTKPFCYSFSQAPQNEEQNRFVLLFHKNLTQEPSKAFSLQVFEKVIFKNDYGENVHYKN